MTKLAGAVNLLRSSILGVNLRIARLETKMSSLEAEIDDCRNALIAMHDSVKVSETE